MPPINTLEKHDSSYYIRAAEAAARFPGDRAPVVGWVKQALSAGARASEFSRTIRNACDDSGINLDSLCKEYGLQEPVKKQQEKTIDKQSMSFSNKRPLRLYDIERVIPKLSPGKDNYDSFFDKATLNEDPFADLELFRLSASMNSFNESFEEARQYAGVILNHIYRNINSPDSDKVKLFHYLESRDCKLPRYSNIGAFERKRLYHEISKKIEAEILASGVISLEDMLKHKNAFRNAPTID